MEIRVDRHDAMIGGKHPHDLLADKPASPGYDNSHRTPSTMANRIINDG